MACCAAVGSRGHEEFSMSQKKLGFSAAAFVAVCAWLPVNAAHAYTFEAGGHGGVNLDLHGDLHLGVDLLFPLAQLSPSVQLSLWPSFAHVFIHDAHDVELLGCDFPFQFRLGESIVSPFVGPGLGLAIFGKTPIKLNVIGGIFVDAGRGVRPFAELALRFIEDTYVDLLFGVVFEIG
jgi:hypothetical protein